MTGGHAHMVDNAIRIPVDFGGNDIVVCLTVGNAVMTHGIIKESMIVGAAAEGDVISVADMILDGIREDLKEIVARHRGLR